ncbi:MAG: galactose mutarotase [Acidimicrobiia bacterium]|nr:galactose mutarotase [Acidimicrobiia bacterium]
MTTVTRLTSGAHADHGAYRIVTAAGMESDVCSRGASLTALRLPDRNGVYSDVVLSSDDHGDDAWLGVTVGRVANRIAGATFTLDDRVHELEANDPPHHLHGGSTGWHQALWSPLPIETPDGPGVQFSLVSPDGDAGYPGTVRATVTYCFTDGHELVVTMRAMTDAPTIVNMANHTYWNLAGHESGAIADHVLTVHASRHTPAGEGSDVPDGRIESVLGSPLDLTTPTRLGERPESFTLNHNYLVDGQENGLRPVARLRHPATGRTLDLEADRSAVQVYTSDALAADGKDGTYYGRNAAVCLETQDPPNAINVPDWERLVILRPGERYEHRMKFRFSIV